MRGVVLLLAGLGVLVRDGDVVAAGLSVPGEWAAAGAAGKTVIAKELQREAVRVGRPYQVMLPRRVQP